MNDRFFSNSGITASEWKSHHGPIRIVDFNEAESLKDRYGAIGCITVSTTNGRIGTMTHLDTTDIDNLDDFIDNLNAVLNENKEDSKVYLSGGSRHRDSIALYNKIKNILLNNNYTIMGSHIDSQSLAPAPKIAKLKKDRIIISEFKGGDKDKFVEINFNDGSVKTYTKQRELPSQNQRNRHI